MITRIATVKSTANKSNFNMFSDSKIVQRQVCVMCCLTFKLLSKVTRNFRAEAAGVWEKTIKFTTQFCVPIIRNCFICI